MAEPSEVAVRIRENVDYYEIVKPRILAEDHNGDEWALDLDRVTVAQNDGMTLHCTHDGELVKVLCQPVTYGMQILTSPSEYEISFVADRVEYEVYDIEIEA